MTLARFARPLIVLALVLLFTLSVTAQESEIKSVADVLSHSLSNSSRPRVAVVDFTDLCGSVTPLGRYVAEELETALANTGGSFDLIDRTRLKLIIEENKLPSQGIIDPSTARQLGKIAGVHILVTGTLVPMSDTVRMTIKALDTEDAHVVAAVPRNLLMTRDLREIIVSAPVTSCTLLPTDKVGDGHPPDQTRIQPAPPTVTEEQQFGFMLKSCVYSGRSVICDLTVTNKADDRNLAIHSWGTTKMFDDQGREFSANEIRLGSHSIANNCCEVTSELISGVSTPAQIIFEKVSSDIQSISKLEIACTDEKGNFSVWFKKIPLSGRR